MNPISVAEDAILAAITTTLGATVRQVMGVGGGWTMDSLKRALQFAPGVYVAFQGGSASLHADAYLDGHYSVYVVNKGADDPDRRRGNTRVIGAYDIVNLLVPALAGLEVPSVGTLHLAGVENLFRDAMFDMGGTVYAIQLSLSKMPFDFQANETALANFTTWAAEHYAPGGIAAGAQPLATDEVPVA